MPSRLRRQGHGWDNAGAERFLPTRTPARLDLEDVDTDASAQTAVFEDIEVVDTRQRGPSAQDYLAPLTDAQPLHINQGLGPEMC
jgi:hypothetical protein